MGRARWPDVAGLRDRPRTRRRSAAQPGQVGHRRVAGGDLADGLDRPVDVVDGVVEGEAQAAARRWIEAERLVGQRRAVAPGAGLDAAPVERFGHGERAYPGEV